VPLPIQSGSLTERLRKFFRIRGKTGFSLDEIVAPVVIIQDLTQGPYQAGVSPAAGQNRMAPVQTTLGWAFAVVLNDKPGSITPVLGNQFNDRSFSFTWAELQNIGLVAADVDDVNLRLVNRSVIVSAGVPDTATNLISIQNSDGSLRVPVEIFGFETVFVTGAGGILWRGVIGDNVNTDGSRRVFENIQPNITIGPNDALLFNAIDSPIATGEIQLNLRGFYQEQPS